MDLAPALALALYIAVFTQYRYTADEATLASCQEANFVISMSHAPRHRFTKPTIVERTLYD
jgi:hypothetical protein